MSQVGIPRPSTNAGGRMSAGSVHLPLIQHPLSRLSRPGDLDVRGSGRSWAGSALGLDGRPDTAQSLSGRPMANENAYPAGRRGSSGRISSRLAIRAAGLGVKASGGGIDAIPEGVEVIHGDPAKTRLPLFGARAGMASRAESRAMSRISTVSAQARLEIDEIEVLLKEKVKANYFEVQKRFKDNDPEGKGNVSRDGLFRIIVTILNRPVNTNQYGRLLDRLRLADQPIISFTEFLAVFREAQSAEYPKWMDPIQRNYTDKASMTATQVHMHLKEKAKQRLLDLGDFVPQSNFEGACRLIKPELLNALNKLGFHMESHEFDKLWDRYDTDGIGTVSGKKLMEKLGVPITEPPAFTAPLMEPGTSDISRPLKKKEAERQRSLNIERWLKNKFREGFSSMKSSFDSFDHKKSGFVSATQFLDVLADYGLRLEKAHLGEFLARCQLEASSVGIPYQDFLVKFLDRSEGGMTHHILTNPKHRYNRADSPGNNSTISALETELMNMFQRDFLSLLGTFHKIDKLGTDMISQEEFRAAIESRFRLDMDETQFRALIDRVPLSEEGHVRYADFMSQFDTRGRADSLFGGEKSKSRYKAIGPVPANPSPVPPKVPSPPPGVRERPPSPIRMDDGTMIDVTPHRSTHELFKLIKNLLKSRYQAVEETFQELDEWNSKRLSQELMFQLLKRFDVSPEITRGEIRDLWKTFITNQDKSLEFQQFTRHFGFSLKSAAYPNAKVKPPQRGDADFRIRSRKLNCAGDMLQDNLRAKIDYMWEALRSEFHAMDPYKTGYVSSDEFREVLSELCVHLSDNELNLIDNKFNIGGDNRVSYLEFLRPFAAKKQVWRHGNNMLSLLQQPDAFLPLSSITEGPQKSGLSGVTAKLRQKLAGDWKSLQRAFKKIDVANSGYLSVPEFRSVLKLANVILDEDEVYHVMSQYDDTMSGQIPYTRFIKELLNPNPQEKPACKSANM